MDWTKARDDFRVGERPSILTGGVDHVNFVSVPCGQQYFGSQDTGLRI